MNAAHPVGPTSSTWAQIRRPGAAHGPPARFFNLTPTAPMGGGTQLFQGAHLTGSIRAIVANQASVAILRFFGLTCAPFNQSI